MSLLSAFFDPTALLMAFAAGAFGASLGALNAFIFTGFAVIAGEAANLAATKVGEVSEAVGANATTLGTVGITGSIAFGVFSPAIAFGGGVAGAAYAAKKGYLDTGFDYHEAKNIAFALGTKPDVLAVGGVFGVVGYWLTQVSVQLSLPFDAIALAVVLSALIARAVFGYDVVGSPRGDGYLDMSPFDREERRVIGEPATDGGEGATDRLAVEPWLPHQYEWASVAVIGAAVGLLGGYTYVVTGSQFLAFGISAASLVFLSLGIEQIPVTHHMALPGSAAAAAVMADGSGLLAGGATLALVVAAVFGLLAALFGEVFQRVVYAHGDTHVDPPAAAIVFGSLLVAVCFLLGLFPGHAYVPIP